MVEKYTLDWRAAVTVLVSTLLLVFDEYHVLWNSDLLTRTLIYLIIPLALIVLVYRQSPADYGWRLGDWRLGLAVTVGGCLLMAGVVLVIGRMPAFSSYYGRQTTGALPFWLADGVELLGWEFFFRGFLFFALYRACGPLSILLQAVPFTMAHLHKPELETWSCMFGGTAFGLIAWRTQSFLYPFLIHWFQVSFMTLVASGAL